MVSLNPTSENQLTKPSAADTFQGRSVSQQRLICQLGVVDKIIMQSISQALSIVLNL